MRNRIAAGALALTTAASTMITTDASAGGIGDTATKIAVIAAALPEQHSHAGHAATLAKARAVAEARRRHAAAVARKKAAAAKAKAKARAAAAAKARAHATAVAKARAARAAARKALYTPSYVWAHKPFSIRVANCESGGGPSDHSTVYRGNAHLHDPNGHFGKWQFDFSTWREVGGHGNPADYTETEQDSRAYDLWRANGWSRWECARMVG